MDKTGHHYATIPDQCWRDLYNGDPVNRLCMFLHLNGSENKGFFIKLVTQTAARYCVADATLRRMAVYHLYHIETDTK